MWELGEGRNEVLEVVIYSGTFESSVRVLPSCGCMRIPAIVASLVEQPRDEEVCVAQVRMFRDELLNDLMHGLTIGSWNTKNVHVVVYIDGLSQYFRMSSFALASEVSLSGDDPKQYTLSDMKTAVFPLSALRVGVQGSMKGW